MKRNSNLYRWLAAPSWAYLALHCPGPNLIKVSTGVIIIQLRERRLQVLIPRIRYRAYICMAHDSLTQKLGAMFCRMSSVLGNLEDTRTWIIRRTQTYFYVPGL